MTFSREFLRRFGNRPRPELGDFVGDGEPVVTHALPVCDGHPPVSAWPTRNLVTGVCPACGQHVADGRPAARVLRARRLVEER